LLRYPLLYDHGWQIDFAALAAASSPRTKALIVVHPNNPTATMHRRQNNRSLPTLCATRNALIADEVFLDFALNNSRARALFLEPSAHLHIEWSLKNLRTATDEIGVDCR